MIEEVTRDWIVRLLTARLIMMAIEFIDENCQPAENRLTGILVANEVSASASAAALKADDCGCSPTMLMAEPVWAEVRTIRWRGS